MAGAQPSPAENFFEGDRALRRLLARRAPGLADRELDRLRRFGAWAAGEVEAQAGYTNRFARPRLSLHGPSDATFSEVVHNPLYLAVHRDVYRHGFVGLNYGPEARPYLLTFVMGYLLAQADISIHCPATLTGAVAYVLARHAPDGLGRTYLAELVRMDGEAMTGATWATEPAGGSDLGATETRARSLGGDGFALTGLKWFASNAECDLALALARPEGAPAGTKGLGLYLVPKRLADGAHNRYRIRRLKEKLGTWGLATGEIELHDAEAVEVAPPPEGFALMMEALEYSRVHNAVAAAGIQRRAFTAAADYAGGRIAFGRPIIDFPMVQDILLDMLARQEAGLALAIEAACAFDEAQADPARRTWLRLATALAKYRTAEDAVAAASRAIEVLGGNGYTEEYVTARLLRDAQVLPVWEGPPNIQALEVLRLVAGKHQGFDAFEGRVRGLLEGAGRLDAGLREAVHEAFGTCGRVAAALRRDPDGEGAREARRLTSLMADTLAAALLIEEAAADLAEGDARKLAVARGFVDARLTPGWRFRAGWRDPWPRAVAGELLAGRPIAPAAAGAT